MDKTTYLINHETKSGFITQSEGSAVDLAGVKVDISILVERDWESVSKERFDQHLNVGSFYHYANPREILK